MRTLIVMLAFLLPCVGSHGTCQTPKEGRRDSANPLTLKEVHRVGRRISHLKKGVSPDEVFKTLRLNRERLFGISGGPANAFHVTYQLRDDYHLSLVFDYTGGPPGRLSSARLSNTRWNTGKLVGSITMACSGARTRGLLSAAMGLRAR
jgi:hypothetical protein